MSKLPSETSQSIDEAQRWLAEHGDYLLNYAFVRTQNREQAEDLVQETFLAAVSARDTFRHASSVRTWLVSILRNKLIDSFRRQQRRPQAENTAAAEPAEQEFDDRGIWARELPVWPNDPAKAMLRQEFWEAFQSCCGKLPQLLFSAYALREFESLSTEEICQQLEISSDTLGMRLYRARMLLRRCLEDTWFGD